MEQNNERQRRGVAQTMNWQIQNSKIAKKFAALALVGATALSFASCNFDSNNPAHNPTQNPSSSSSQTTSQQGNQSNEKYSEMLMNVVNDPEIQTLITNAQQNEELFDSAVFDPHPYAFLEDEGYDVNAIKNGETECYTMSYVLDEEPNNLYIATRLLVNDDYYATYLLKYKLSDKEMSDYRSMHGRYDVDYSYKIYATFLNNEISETKEATIVGKSKFSKKTIETHGPYYPNAFKYAPTKPCRYIMINPSIENNTVEFVLTPLLKGDETMVCHSYIYKCLISSLAKYECVGDIFINAPHTSMMSFEEKSQKDATFFYPQDAYLNSEFVLETIN